jgi:inosine/xanthosine triphosphate pyrophosphatase family protein
MTTVPDLCLLTSNNPGKLAEYRSMGLPLRTAPGPDLPEVDGTPEEIAVHKAVAAGPGTLVEDTVLEVDGQLMIDIRWRLGELGSREGARAVYHVSLCANDGEAIRIYRGRCEGTLLSPAVEPPDAFGFDAFLVPDGSGGLSLYELARLGRRAEFSARARAAEAFMADDAAFEVALGDVEPWTGGWQGTHP